MHILINCIVRLINVFLSLFTGWLAYNYSTKNYNSILPKSILLEDEMKKLGYLEGHGNVNYTRELFFRGFEWPIIIGFTSFVLCLLTIHYVLLPIMNNFHNKQN